MTLRWRLVLNAGPPLAKTVDAEVGEELQRLMLRALVAHTTARGAVDYAALRVSPEFHATEEAAGRLRAIDVERLGPRPTRLAFWINIYNALSLHGIIGLGVTRTVWQVPGFFARVSYRVGALTLNLDEIEHGILRGNARRMLPPWPPFGPRDPRRALALAPPDPRVHFALTCGARSCPPVGVYRASAIDAQLDMAARSFINQEVVLQPDGVIACSRLFKWYRRDFGDDEHLRGFLVRYLDDGAVKAALSGGAGPCRSFRRYSWALQHPAAK